ncbi:rCG48741 [Rattus norvegicus]|uniref:RCG48741 n=1 Tax=Rattus norvegicus TaxID=10116 RepID=A6IGY7_RAT|nr:rCG48741 [Rattus norvegicus]
MLGWWRDEKSGPVPKSLRSAS